MMGGMDGGRRFMEQDVLKPKNLSVTIARFGTYFRHYWLHLTLVLIFAVVSVWAVVTVPKITEQATNCYIAPRNLADCTYASVTLTTPTAEKIDGLLQLALIALGLYVLNAVMSGLAFYVMRDAGQRVLLQMRKELFEKIHVLSLGYYAEHEAGEIMSRVTNDTDTISQAFSFALLNLFTGFLTIGWVMVNMLQANVPYALLSLIVVPFMAVVTAYFSNQARKAFRKSRKEMGSVNADLQESISGAREVQAFNREDESIERFRQTNAANRDINIRAAAFTSALSPALEALGYVSLGIVVIVGGMSALTNQPLLPGTGVVSLGLVLAFLQYSQRFNQPIQQIALLWTNVQSAIAGGERIFTLLDTDVDILDKPNAKIMPEIKGLVRFENVSAEYQPGEPVLKGVSFEAEPGKTIAIVGPTGAGKTTIINLIPRFYDVTEGAVTIDGIDVRDVTQASLRDQIAIVLQDSFLFSNTVMENIRYGRLDATDEEVIAAATLVQANTFIERLSDGYQTILGERGTGLSQGQRQLISIARAALVNPRILILDEATSSVDTRTERLIQQALEKLLAGRTSFVIAHRLSTIRSADTVMMVKDGQILERGTHQALLDQQGAYYDLYMSQFRIAEEAPTTAPVNGAKAPLPSPAGD
ncbi:MAG: ABC transporter ATP-binding protein [Anaerolineae bacterium]|nr:ABC transporter ATP-binding protein [Anaerolineae bacterium]